MLYHKFVTAWHAGCAFHGETFTDELWAQIILLTSHLIIYTTYTTDLLGVNLLKKLYNK